MSWRIGIGGPAVSRLRRIILLSSSDHPAMVWEGWLASSQAALGVVVAAGEEEDDQGEKDGYDAVAGRHARL